ncbi:hypothetical protein Hdeb2414_s0017g00512211 [Helianthus debilis subsp. tardiflorus]
MWLIWDNSHSLISVWLEMPLLKKVFFIYIHTTDDSGGGGGKRGWLFYDTVGRKVERFQIRYVSTPLLLNYCTNTYALLADLILSETIFSLGFYKVFPSQK